MAKLEFSINLPSKPDKLLQLATDYEKLSTYLPRQLSRVKIIEKNNNETITEETLTFKTVVKNNIEQKSKHTVLGNKIVTEIIDGPAKGTMMQTVYDKIESGTKVTVTVNLKLTLRAMFLQPLVKKLYKSMLTGVLYKMNNVIMQENGERKTID